MTTHRNGPHTPRGREGRFRPRRSAQGLTLTCTRPAVASHPAVEGVNLSLELRDVGWGGVLFVASQPLQAPCPLSLQLREESTGEVLTAKGEVAWSQTRLADGRVIHLVGARFDEIFTPPAKCSRFFEEPASGKRARNAEASSQRPRDADRFPVDECEVTLYRDKRPGLFRRPENLALELLDLSRTGAQVTSKAALKVGEKVRLTVHLKKFKDTFEVEAETAWSRFPVPHEGLAWRAGLEFGALDGPRKRLLESMESWFTYSRSKIKLG